MSGLQGKVNLPQFIRRKIYFAGIARPYDQQAAQEEYYLTHTFSGSGLLDKSYALHCRNNVEHYLSRMIFIMI
jgi:hypothetical protein